MLPRPGFKATWTNRSNRSKERSPALKKGLDSKLAELGNYNQQLGELQRDLSLMDKKLKKMEMEGLSQAKLDEKIRLLKEDLNSGITKLDKQVQTLDLKLTTTMAKLQKELDASPPSSSPAPQKIPVSEPVKPKVNIDTSNPATIKQKVLTD